MNFFRNFPTTEYDFLGDGYKYTIQNFTRYANIDSSLLDNVSLYQYYEIPDGARPDVVSTLLYNTPEYYWTFFLINDFLKTNVNAWPLSGQEFEDYMEENYTGRSFRVDNIIGEDWIPGVTEGEVDAPSLGSPYSLGTLHSVDYQLGILNFKGDYSDLSFTEDESEDPEGFGVTLSGGYGVQEMWEYRYATRYYEDSDGKRMPSNTAYDNKGTYTEISNNDYELSVNSDRRYIRVIKPEYIYEFANHYDNIINAGA